jgi:site-specific recombinase XerD
MVMATELVKASQGRILGAASGFILPAVIADQGDKAAERFFTFFTDTIPNANTRAAYYRNVMRFFAWTHAKGLSLPTIKSYHVSGYLAELANEHATPTVKQHLASLRMLFDWLITGQVIDANPAAAVRAAKHVVKKGKTPVLKADEARELLDSIPLMIGPEPKDGEPDSRPPSLIGLRDRVLIAVMVFSFARIGAALGMKVEDYYTEGRRAWFRLHEKGGKRHEVPAHHNAEDYLDAYIAAAGIAGEGNPPLLLHRPAPPVHRPTDAPDRCLADDQTPCPGHRPAGGLCNHTFRVTGITAGVRIRSGRQRSDPQRPDRRARPGRGRRRRAGTNARGVLALPRGQTDLEVFVEKLLNRSDPERLNRSDPERLDPERLQVEHRVFPWCDCLIPGNSQRAPGRSSAISGGADPQRGGSSG